MKEGFIFLYRKLLNWEWFQDVNMLQLFIYLLLKANYEDSNYRGYQIKRGSLVFGRLQASKDLKRPPSTVYKCLKRLASTGEIQLQGNNRFSIVTISNYDTYQSLKEKTEQPRNNKATTAQQQGSSKVTTGEQPGSIYKEDNNIISKEEKEINKSASDSFSFEYFWKLYNKDINQYQCRYYWEHELRPAEKELISLRLPAYIESTPDKKFRKDPLNYLAEKAWLNEIVNSIPPKKEKSAIDRMIDGEFEITMPLKTL